MFHYDLTSTWEKKLENIEAERMQIAISMIPNECKTLIDLGTGDGSLLYAIENSIDPINKIKCRGVERSLNAIKLKKCISDIECRENFHYIENETQSDLIVSMAVLEHLKNSEVDLKKDLIEKVSKKYLLVSVPYKEKRVNVKCPHCDCCFNPYWHLRSYDISSLTKLFSRWNIKKTYIFKTKISLLDFIIRYFGITLSAKEGRREKFVHYVQMFLIKKKLIMKKIIL